MSGIMQLLAAGGKGGVNATGGTITTTGGYRI